MAWYEYTTWKSNIGAITADVRGLLAKRRARRDEAIKAEMRAEIVKAVGEIVKPKSQIIDLLGKHLDQQDRRFAEIEKKRSEEHTSELQSLRHLVCRLLLEKKKKKII